MPVLTEMPVTVIEPSKGWVALRLDALWRFRELLYFLVWRDVKVRYKQTVLGAAWAILQPLLTMVIFSIFFGKLSGLIDFAIAFVVLLGLMTWYGIAPTSHIAWLPPLVLLALVTALGAGLWFSALNVLYRDIQYVVPFLVQVWLYATPIVYPSSLVPERWRPLYALNPMVGVVEGFRWALLGTGTAPGPMILVSAVAAIAMLVGGLFFFRRMEKSFSDAV
jgi:lipopolysaccharide transport system permease protein